MIKVKTIKFNSDNSNCELFDEHSIYLLSDDEQIFNDAPGKYLLHKTYSEWAMNSFEAGELIRRAINDSGYVFGVAFANTIEEAELKYQNAVLKYELQNYQRYLKRVSDELSETMRKITLVCNQIDDNSEFISRDCNRG